LTRYTASAIVLDVSEDLEHLEKERKITMGKKHCDFLFVNIGRKLFSEIQQHLIDCPICRKVFQQYYSDYYRRKKLSPDEGFAPMGLSHKNFLRAWHTSMVRGRRESSFLQKNILKRLDFPEGLRCLRKILAGQARLFYLLELNAPKAVIEGELDLLIESYRKFRETLGIVELAYLLGQDPGDFESFLESWKKFLLRS